MSAHKDKKRSTWYYRARYKDINGLIHQTRKSGFKTKKEAENAEREFINSYSKEVVIINNMTFESLYIEYKNFIFVKLKLNSVNKIESRIKTHIMPFFKNKYINNITTKDIILWQKEIIKNNFKYSYKKSLYTAFRLVINFAIKMFGLKNDPLKLVGNFKNDEIRKTNINFWTTHEFEKFTKVVNSFEWKVFFLFLYLTVFRKGEAQALTWEDIDFLKNEIIINKTFSHINKNGKIITTTPKTKSSIRTILINKQLKEYLIMHYNEESKKVEWNKNCFIFGCYFPLSATTITRNKNYYCNLANVKQIRIHDFRHSHASLLISNGADISIVAQRLGHSDIVQTLNTYTHMFPNKQEKIINLIDNICFETK